MGNQGLIATGFLGEKPQEILLEGRCCPWERERPGGRDGREVLTMGDKVETGGKSQPTQIDPHSFSSCHSL